jgi:hypothetical protein
MVHFILPFIHVYRLMINDQSTYKIGVEAIIHAIHQRFSWSTCRLNKVYLYQNDVPTREIGRLRGLAWAPTIEDPTLTLHHHLFL